MLRSPSRLQFFAAAAAAITDAVTTTTTIMSSRPAYRGGRNQWRRSFSDRSCNGDGGRVVTGDSHFQSVRDANRGPRQGEGGSFANQSGFQPQPSNQRVPPPFEQNYQFRQPPVYFQNPQFYPRPPYNQYQQFHQPPMHDRNPLFHQQLRPRPPRPLDYRSWEYAKTVPPPNGDRFVILSYNILADYLAIDHWNKLYFHIPRHMLEWQWRKRNIMFELRLWSADIMCLQEVDRFHELEEELKLQGYSGIWKMRTGNPIDGCAIFWRTSRFKLLYEECVEFNKLGLRDNVAQICVLELMSQTANENKAALPSTSSTSFNKVVICNIHVLYNPKRGEIKLGQVRVLLDRAHAVSKNWNDAPVVLCGDFNCTPKSPLYNFISEQKLDLSGLDRDKVSGQASAEIRAPRPYNSYPGTGYRVGSVDNSVRPPPVLDGKGIDIKMIDSVSDMQKENNLDGNLENLSSVNNLFQPQYTDTLLDVSDKSFPQGQCRNEESASRDEVGKEIHQNGADKFNDEAQTAAPVLPQSLLESLNTHHSKEACCDYQMKDGVHISPPVVSHSEDVYCDVIQAETSEKAIASQSGRGSSSKCSDPNIYTKSEKENFESPSPTFEGDYESDNARINMESMSSFNSDISSSELLCQTDSVEISSPGSSKNLLFQPIANDDHVSRSTPYPIKISYASSNADSVIDEKLEKLSLDEHDELTVKVGSDGEDESTFLNALHNNEDDFIQFHSSNSDHSSNEHAFVPKNPQLHSPRDEVPDEYSPGLNSMILGAEKTTYNPSVWTPTEIETATGKENCTILEHSLKLESTYTDVEDCSGARDLNGEPMVTSYNRCFMGAVDYIWRSEGLQTVRVLAPIPKNAMQWTPGFPTKKWGSDHIALASELTLTKRRD